MLNRRARKVKDPWNGDKHGEFFRRISESFTKDNVGIWSVTDNTGVVEINHKMDCFAPVYESDGVMEVVDRKLAVSVIRGNVEHKIEEQIRTVTSRKGEMDNRTVSKDKLTPFYGDVFGGEFLDVCI